MPTRRGVDSSPRPRPDKPAVAPATPSSALAVFCRSLPGVSEDIKWEDDLVFSIGGKMFAAFDLEDPGQFSFKCTEEEFLGLIQKKGIVPAPYLARALWVKVMTPRALSTSESKRLLRGAYTIVRSGLTKKTQASLPPLAER